jgi:hypothetical protein
VHGNGQFFGLVEAMEAPVFMVWSLVLLKSLLHRIGTACLCTGLAGWPCEAGQLHYACREGVDKGVHVTCCGFEMAVFEQGVPTDQAGGCAGVIS